MGLVVMTNVKTMLVGTGRDPRQVESEGVFTRVIGVNFPSTLRATLCGVTVAFVIHFVGRVSISKVGIATHSCTVRVTGFSCYIKTTLTRTGTVVAN